MVHRVQQKSYLHKIVKRTIDPSIPELLDLPHDKNELLQQLDHNWLAFYDNLTSLSNEVSDCLCRAVTGGGFSKRELYSDDDDTVYDFKRCVGLNGINPAASRPDLLDRSVLTSVTKIDDKDRKTEKVVDAAFEADKTSILGGFLTILSEALKKYKVVNLDSYQRLADFHVYGCAISLALGKTAEEFTKAYENKVEGQTEEALNASLVALSLIDFCDKHFKRDVSGSRIIQGNWEGTPSELLDVLTDNCIHLGIKTDFRSKWPKSPSTFGKRINELIPSMYRKGYDIIVKAGTPRQIIIAETPEQIEKYNPKTEDTKDLKTRIEETFGQIIIAYQKGGMVKTETIQDKEALTQLLKDDKLLSPQEGFVIPNRSA